MPLIPVRVTETWEFPVVHGQRLVLPPHALVVDFCLAPRGQAGPPPDGPWFPAVIDTGTTHNFSLCVGHFGPSAVAPLADFRKLGTIVFTYADGRRDPRKRPLYDGDLWARSQVAPTLPPLRIELSEGFALFDPDGPPYPILGTAALATAGLRLAVDYEGRRAALTWGGPLRFGDFLLWHGAVTQAQLDRALTCQHHRRRTQKRLTLVEATVPPGPHRGVLRMRVGHEDVGRTIGQIASALNVHTDGPPPAAPDDYLGEVLVENGAIGHAAMLTALQAFHALRAAVPT